MPVAGDELLPVVADQLSRRAVLSHRGFDGPQTAVAVKRRTAVAPTANRAWASRMSITRHENRRKGRLGASICHRSSGAWFKAPPLQHIALLLLWWYRCIALYTKMNRDTAGTTAGMTTAMTTSSSWQCGQRATPLDLGEPIKCTCERWRKHATGTCGNVERVCVQVNPMPLSGALVT
jgi:hypothetical protein